MVAATSARAEETAPASRPIGVLAARYDRLFAFVEVVRTPVVPSERTSGWHLYPVRLQTDDPATSRQSAFTHLRANGIGVNVHYQPVYLHSSYRTLGYPPGLTHHEQGHVVGLLAEAVTGEPSGV